MEERWNKKRTRQNLTLKIVENDVFSISSNFRFSWALTELKVGVN